MTLSGNAEPKLVSPQTRPRSPVLAVLLATVAVVLAALLVWALLHIRHLDSVVHKDSATEKSQAATISHFQTEDDLRSSALQAGQLYGVWLSSYNYQDLTSSSSDWSQVEAHADATFQHDFATTTPA